MKFLGLLIAALALTSTVATTASAATCLYKGGIRSYEVVGNDAIKVRDGSRYYKMELGFCSQLRWADQIAFIGRSSWVCAGDQLALLDFTGRVIDRCWIDNITQTTRRGLRTEASGDISAE